jgi:hypothetical protein
MGKSFREKKRKHDRGSKKKCSNKLKREKQRPSFKNHFKGLDPNLPTLLPKTSEEHDPTVNDVIPLFKVIELRKQHGTHGSFISSEEL